jgi:hypothetical protein
MVWLYATVALAAGAVAILCGNLVRDKSAKRRMGGWLCYILSACFFLTYFFEGEHDLLILAIGWTCWVAGVLAFGIPRRSAGTSGQS